MKILFIGDSDGAERILAPVLRERGHIVDCIGPVASRPEFQLMKRPGILGSSRYLYDIMKMLPAMRGYDAVQLGSHMFFDLKPGRLSYLVRELGKYNRALYLSAWHPGYFFAEACVRRELFRFSPYRTGSYKSVLAKCNPEAEYDAMQNAWRDYERFLVSQMAGVMALSPEMEIALRPVVPEILHSVPFPVEKPSCYAAADTSGKVPLVVPGSRLTDLKEGRDSLRRMAHELVSELPEYCVLSDAQSDRTGIWFDSLCRYSPSTEALAAMSRGMTVVTGCQPEYIVFTGAEKEPPVICGAPGREVEIKKRLRTLICSPEERASLSVAGAGFVRKYHSAEAAAVAFEQLWEIV